MIRNFSSLFIIFIILLLPKNILAQEISNYSFSYPIKELGNCQNKNECYYYCEQAKNKAFCWSYLENIIGLNSSTNYINNLIKHFKIEFPISSLGYCSSVSDCKYFCSLPRNYSICTQFSENVLKSNNKVYLLSKLTQNLEKKLDCHTDSDCKNKCNDNHMLCMTTLEETKILVTENKKINNTYSSCKNDKSCIDYCSNNQNLCQGFKEYLKNNNNYFVGPTGCTTRKDCKLYCDSYPYLCPGYNEYNLLNNSTEILNSLNNTTCSSNDSTKSGNTSLCSNTSILKNTTENNFIISP